MIGPDAPPLPILVDERVRTSPDRIALTSVEQGSITWSELSSRLISMGELVAAPRRARRR